MIQKIHSLPNLIENFQHFGSRLYERYGLFILFEEYVHLRKSFIEAEIPSNDRLLTKDVKHRRSFGYVLFKGKTIFVVASGTGKGKRIITALPYKKYQFKNMGTSKKESLSVKTLSLFDSTKEQRLQVAANVLDAIDNGNVDIMKIHCHLKAMEEIKTILTDRSEKNKHKVYADKYMDALFVEAEKYAGKSFELHNAKFTKTEVGTKYDYSKCNDPIHADLAAQLETLKEKVKEREEFLKNLPEEGLDQVNQETGEAYKMYRPSKSSTSSITVSLK